MFKIFLGLHLLTAIFLIGPLAHAVTTASRGLRTSDAVATAASARMARIYAIGKPVNELSSRVAASGGVVGLAFVAIVFLMVYQPGS